MFNMTTHTMRFLTLVAATLCVATVVQALPASGRYSKRDEDSPKPDPNAGGPVKAELNAAKITNKAATIVGGPKPEADEDD